MPGTKRLGALLALLAAAVAVSGCGSDEVSGEIPADNAARLKGALTGVSTAIASQDCGTAASKADDFVAEVNLLPLDAGEELKAELRNAGEHLGLLVSEECASTEPPTTTSSTTSTTPTSTSSTTETSTTDTTSSTDTTTTSTDQTQPPGDGDGDGAGGGPGDGGTGGTGSGSGDETDE